MLFLLRPRLLLVALFALLFVGACSHHPQKRFLSNPENPYPLSSPPKVGEIEHLPTGTRVSEEQMLRMAGDARIVYLGETHDNPASHRLELQVLKALNERHPGRQALGMEMFRRSKQQVLDRWVAGELDEKGFLKASGWFEDWKSDFAYYREILNYCREQHIPIIALNAEKSQVAALRSRTPEALDPKERAELPELDFGDPYQRALVASIFGAHVKEELALQGFVRAQTLWDETMAESAARYLLSPQGEGKHLLVIAGSYHVNYGFGIPRRVFRRLPTSYLLIGGEELDLSEDKADRVMDVDLPRFPMVPYDFLVYLKYEDLPVPTMKLGVAFEPAPEGAGLLVRTVEPESNAARAGVRVGDLLVSLDGEKLADSFDLVYAVRQKRPGQRGVLKLRRQDKALELPVTFEPKAKGKPEMRK